MVMNSEQSVLHHQYPESGKEREMFGWQVLGEICVRQKCKVTDKELFINRT